MAAPVSFSRSLAHELRVTVDPRHCCFKRIVLLQKALANDQPQTLDGRPFGITISRRISNDSCQRRYRFLVLEPAKGQDDYIAPRSTPAG